MAQYCENCGKFMKNSDVTHCSDECLFELIKNSESLNETGFDAIAWGESTDPWN